MSLPIVGKNANELFATAIETFKWVWIAGSGLLKWLVHSMPYENSPDDNRSGSDEYPSRLNFYCPNTNCVSTVKLQDRSHHQAILCENCGLEYAIGADPELQRNSKETLNAVLAKKEADTNCESSHPLNFDVEESWFRDASRWILFSFGIVCGLFIAFCIRFVAWFAIASTDS